MSPYDQVRTMTAAAPAVNSQVREECQAINRSLDELTTLIHNFEARLQDVMRAPAPTDAVKAPSKPNLVPHAIYLWDVADRVNGLCQRLIDINERIEL